mgnify:CR=1 FL=1
MGTVKKLCLSARTLDDVAIKDGLEAVTVLNGKEPYFLVGGIATQSYLPTICRRPTSDIDFALVRPLSKPDFRQMIHPVKEHLHDIGYESSLKVANASRSYPLYFWKPEKDCDVSCIEFVRRGKKKFMEHEKRLKREYENSRQKIVEGRKATCLVCSPEDIAVPKLVRSINSLGRNQGFIDLIPSRLKPLSEKEIGETIEILNQFRVEAMTNPGDPYLAERLRFVSDIYDMRILSEITGFNKDYFAEAERDWKDISEHPEIENKILRVALPMFLEGQK